MVAPMPSKRFRAEQAQMGKRREKVEEKVGRRMR
jgi:hypothetical protein